MVYNVTCSTYHNDKFINCVHGTKISDTKPENKTVEITWDNLEELFRKNALICSFDYRTCSKGRVVTLFSQKLLPIGDYADIKEWKKPELNIKVVYRYYEKID